MSATDEVPCGESCWAELGDMSCVCQPDDRLRSGAWMWTPDGPAAAGQDLTAGTS